MKSPRHPAADLGAAVVAVLAAWGLRVALTPALGERVPFITFFPAMFVLAWWGGLRFADLLAAHPPAPGARWASMRSAVSLDGRGRPTVRFTT